MNYYYSASTMGYGFGRKWHGFFDFPKFPCVTKTLTMKPKKGFPFAVIRLGNSVFNKVSLHNMGFFNWLNKYGYYNPDIIISLSGNDDEIEKMIYFLEINNVEIKGVELNFSCPNVKDNKNRRIPNTKYDLYLKLNYLMNPYEYNLDSIKSIRLNSVPLNFCGGSGYIAQQKNWNFIEKNIKEGLNVSGCSIICKEDLKRLENIGVNEIGLGSVLLINPRLVESIGG